MSSSGQSDDSTGGAGTVGNPSNRRRFPRLRAASTARLRHIDGVSLPVAGLSASTVNLSDGGLCLRSATPLAPESVVAVELAIEASERPLVAMARVVYCEPAERGYDVGVEFVWVGWDESGARRALADHLRTALEEADRGAGATDGEAEA